MLESIVVVAVVAVAGVFVLTRVYREATGKKSSCNCGEACPLNKSQGCSLPEDIRDASAPNAPEGCPLDSDKPHSVAH